MVDNLKGYHTYPYKIANFTLENAIRYHWKNKPDTKTRAAYADDLTTRYNAVLDQKWEKIMGKKTKKAEVNNWGVKFCSIELDTPSKEKMKKWASENYKDLETYGDAMIRSGWKTSLSWSDDNDCFIAASTQQDEDDENHKVCVTSRSNNMFEALILNYYKIFVLYKNSALPTERKNDNWG